MPQGALSAVVSTPFSFVIGAQRLSPFHLGRQHIPEGGYRLNLNVFHSVPCLQIYFNLFICVAALKILKLLCLKDVAGVSKGHR